MLVSGLDERSLDLSPLNGARSDAERLMEQMARAVRSKVPRSLQKWFGRLAKLEQVGCFGDGAARLVVAKTPKAVGLVIDPVRGV